MKPVSPPMASALPPAPERRAHGDGEPSPWIRRWSSLVPAGASVLDLACGHGRHTRWFAGRGARVTAVDRDAAAIAPLAALAETLVTDLEDGPWPWPAGVFDAVVVTNYLWRPLLPTLVASVAPGGCLLYETFGVDHAAIGRPSNPAFLLRPGELLAACAGLRVVAYEDGFLAGPDRFVQRIAAVREAGDAAAAGCSAAPPRRLLASP